MNSIQKQIQNLAFMADRRILHLEDEEHVRLDLLAHETASHFVQQKAISVALPAIPKLPDLSWFKEYAFMATLLFSVMIFLSSVPANYKIAMSNITGAQEVFISELKVMEGTLLTQDLWTGEKVGVNSPVIETLEAKEESVLVPNDGVLNVLSSPSSYEDRISIPSLNLDAPLVMPELGRTALDSEDWNELEDQIRSSLLDGVVHYPGTAEPGKKGNFFVTGHSSNVFWEQSVYNSVFALLPKIEVGTEIVVTKNQREYTYVVTEKREVSPKDVSVLTQGDDYQMTLMTCTPVGTTLNRLVVSAELKH